MPRVAKKKFEIKPIPQLTFKEQVNNAFCDMQKKLGTNCYVIGSCIKLSEKDQSLAKMGTFHDFPTEVESNLNIAAIPVADIINRMAQGWNVEVDGVLEVIKGWLDVMKEAK